MKHTKKVSAFVGASVLMIAFFVGIKIQSMKPTEHIAQESIITPVVTYLYQTIKITNKFLRGHTNQVRCVAYSPDGTYIVSGAEDHHLIIWNGETGDLMKTLEGHFDSVTCVAWNPKGTYIVSGSEDNNLIIWDSNSGDQLKILKGHTSGVTCVAWSPDGSYIVSGSEDNNLIIWNVNTGKKTKVLKEHTGGVTGVAWSPNDDRIVSVGEDGQLILWDSKTGSIKGLAKHEGPAWCVAYSPHGNSIVSGTDYGDLIIWNSDTGALSKILKGHTGSVTCVTYSQDGNYIISGAEGRSAHLILWNGNTGDQMKVFEEDHRGVRCLAYSSDGSSMVSGISFGKSLLLWNLSDLQTINFIATKLNNAQARFLYHLYQAHVDKMLPQDLHYRIFLTLPENVQHMVKKNFPSGIAYVFEQEVQKKMNDLRSALFYGPGSFLGEYEKTYDEKIAAIQNAMKKFNQSSVEYKACERLLIELIKSGF